MKEGKKQANWDGKEGRKESMRERRWREEKGTGSQERDGEGIRK